MSARKYAKRGGILGEKYRRSFGKSFKARQYDYRDNAALLFLGA